MGRAAPWRHSAVASTKCRATPQVPHAVLPTACLQYYASEAGGGWQGVHSEGGVWATLFGLLLWDVLFCTDVPDVLRTPFQTAPLDLDTDAFFPARQVSELSGRVGL